MILAVFCSQVFCAPVAQRLERHSFLLWKANTIVSWHLPNNNVIHYDLMQGIKRLSCFNGTNGEIYYLKSDRLHTVNNSPNQSLPQKAQEKKNKKMNTKTFTCLFWQPSS